MLAYVLESFVNGNLLMRFLFLHGTFGRPSAPEGILRNPDRHPSVLKGWDVPGGFYRYTPKVWKINLKISYKNYFSSIFL